MDRLRVVLVGCGAMGSRHARVLSSDPECEWLAVDIVPLRAQKLAERHGVRASTVIPAEIDAAIVATPTSTHVAVGEPLLQRGLFCLVEKPLAETVLGARQLAGPRCQAGHVERFNPAIRAAGIVRPLTIEARRLAPPTGRGLDVDVVLDLMIHDLDLLLQWTAPDIEWSVHEAQASPTSGNFDTVSASLGTRSGSKATLLASRVASEKERRIRCVEDGRDTLIDLLAGVAHREGAILPDTGPRDALTAQWVAFTSLARGEGSSAPTDSGLRAVELAQKIRASIRTGTIAGAA